MSSLARLSGQQSGPARTLAGYNLVHNRGTSGVHSWEQSVDPYDPLVMAPGLSEQEDLKPHEYNISHVPRPRPLLPSLPLLPPRLGYGHAGGGGRKKGGGSIGGSSGGAALLLVALAGAALLLVALAGAAVLLVALAGAAVLLVALAGAAVLLVALAGAAVLMVALAAAALLLLVVGLALAGQRCC
eukprot:Em0002g966a